MEMRKRGRLTRRLSWIAVASVFVLQLGAAEPENSYLVTNLVSDVPDAATHNDPLLVNAWGIAFRGNTSPWWVNVNGSNISELYDKNGGASMALPLVHVPGAPTGIVGYLGTGFHVSNGVTSAASLFLFDAEDGTISGWNPNVQSPPPPSPTRTFVVVPNASAPAHDAIYKGLALAQTQSGDFLYAADFHNNHVDVFNGTFHPVVTAGGFVDPKLPKGYAPFGIQNIQNRILVSYAKQDKDAEDEIDGDGLGFVDAYDTDGNFLARIASRGALNAPWGMAMAPADFGRFSNMLLVGNFGDGHINAIDPQTFEVKGQLKNPQGKPIVIDGLWGIGFGNGGAAGLPNVLYFAAGPNHEAHGLFGRIDAN
jgi:uncharacterized protein (TIGR03118 family)